MVLLSVLGEDVKGAFLKECEAAYRLFSSRVQTRFVRSVGMSVSDMCFKRNLNINEY